MVSRLLILLGLLCTISTVASSQNASPRYTVGVESHYLFAGQINASFDFLAGVRGQYFFNKQGGFTSFVSAGLATDIFNTNAKLVTSDVMIGTHWKFHTKFSAAASIGGQYVNESHRFELIEGEKVWQNSIIGVTGMVNVNYHLSDTISTTLFFKQLNLTYTAVGVGVQYSF